MYIRSNFVADEPRCHAGVAEPWLSADSDQPEPEAKPSLLVTNYFSSGVITTILLCKASSALNA